MPNLPSPAAKSLESFNSKSLAIPNELPVAIVGGGPIGMSLALLLARAGIRCAVIESRTLAQASADDRLLALSRGTVDTLWPLLEPQARPAHGTINRVRVSSAGQFGSTTLTSEESRVSSLGLTVRYGSLLTSLHESVCHHPGIAVLQPAHVTEIDQRPDSVCIRMEGRDPLEACIAVRAEGNPVLAIARERSGPLRPRAHADSGAPSWGIVADLRFSPGRGPGAGDAIERFTRDGPLALLPTPERNDTCSLVWCMAERTAALRMALGERSFLHELAQSLGPRIGSPDQIGVRNAHVLRRHALVHVRQHRVLHIGNAAQTLHPVAGQGFNLGMRDCAVLATHLTDAFTGSGGDGNETTTVRVLNALSCHAAARRNDRYAVRAITTVLPALFASRFGPLASARSLGLFGFDAVAPARRMLGDLFMYGVR